jgi:hypothetical protein
MGCAALALDEEVIALQRGALREAGKFSDFAGLFCANADQPTVMALAAMPGGMAVPVASRLARARQRVPRTDAKRPSEAPRICSGETRGPNP